MTPKNDREYYGRRERDHRAQAEAAVTDEARQAHFGFAEQYAAKCRGQKGVIPLTQSPAEPVH